MQAAQPITGILDAYWEQGTEGIVWTVYDPAHNNGEGKRTHAGLTLIDSGDYLRVFNDSAKQEIVWEGNVKLDFKCDVLFHHFYPMLVSQRIEGKTVNGIPENVDPSAWLHMFMDEKPCELVKAGGPAPRP